jgi:hypothetical protein
MPPPILGRSFLAEDSRGFFYRACDYIGFSCILVGVEEYFRSFVPTNIPTMPRGLSSFAGFIGVALLLLGETGPNVWRKISSRYKSEAFEAVLAENAQLKVQVASLLKRLENSGQHYVDLRAAQLMVSKIILTPPPDPTHNARLEIFLKNRGDLAAEDWVVNSATVITTNQLTPAEQAQGVSVARMPLPLPSGQLRQYIQPGDEDVGIACDEPRVTVELEKPFFYYVYVCVVYRDKTHQRQHWVTEYGAHAVDGFDRWHPCGNRRIFLEDD